MIQTKQTSLRKDLYGKNPWQPFDLIQFNHRPDQYEINQRSPDYSRGLFQNLWPNKKTEIQSE